VATVDGRNSYPDHGALKMSPSTKTVRARVLSGVRAGEIIERRSRQRWKTSDTTSRLLTDVERVQLLALLGAGEVRYVPSGGQRYGIGEYVIVAPNEPS
jgi:hypothetical protein